MSQHDMDIANAAGASIRADVNNALLALVSNSSGATEPATTFAYQLWADTTTGLLKQRNAANSAWITILTLAGGFPSIELGHASDTTLTRVSAGVVAVEGNNIITTATVGSYSGSGFKNIIINGGFTINQRVYVSSAVLASGSYGHDRWKAGSGGGDYSFTQLASNTTITIAANKTLIQVVEDKNVASTAYVLSWEGTALARYAVNSATPAGSYAASPILITGQTAGTTMSIEFGNGASAGTLGKVQLEAGSVATPFETRPYGVEEALCQRYYYRKTFGASEPVAVLQAYSAIGAIGVLWYHPQVMQASPTRGGTSEASFQLANSAGTLAAINGGGINANVNLVKADVARTGSGLVAGDAVLLAAPTSGTGYIDLTSEL